MRTLFTLFGLLSYFMTYAQVCGFETPGVFPSEYTDTGDPSLPHALLDNPNEPYVNWPSNGNELGFSAHYVPYDSPDIGLTDGDEVGVTDTDTIVGNYPEGTQGFVISDVDGNFILEFEPVVSTSTNATFSIQYFIAETGYEGDGTSNASGSDRLRIYIRELTGNTEMDVLNTTGFDINDLGIEGQWQQVSVNLPAYNGNELHFQVVIEARNNSSSEAFFFDDLQFDLTLGNQELGVEKFRLYPNPATDFVQISGLQDQLPVTVQFYDVLGKEVARFDQVATLLPIHHLKSGLYFVKIIQGERQKVLKLVKP